MSKKSKRQDHSPPAGKWCGFYIQPDSPRRYPMSFQAEFEGGVLEGSGDDVVGPFRLVGSFDAGDKAWSWEKIYNGKHTVNYRGRQSGVAIVGQWNIRDNWGGPFFVWPEELGDRTAEFEQSYIREMLDWDHFD